MSHAVHYGSLFYGDALDGDVTVADGATVTLTRDMYYGTLTVTGTLRPAGFRVFAKTSVVVSSGGRIENDGLSASGATAGAALAAAGSYFGGDRKSVV